METLITPGMMPLPNKIKALKNIHKDSHNLSEERKSEESQNDSDKEDTLNHNIDYTEPKHSK